MKLNIPKEELKKRFPNLTETEVDELFNFDLSISSPNAVNLSDLDNNDSFGASLTYKPKKKLSPVKLKIVTTKIDNIQLVKAKIEEKYSRRVSANLLGFYTLIEQLGKIEVKKMYPKPTFYRRLKQLRDASISIELIN